MRCQACSLLPHDTENAGWRRGRTMLQYSPTSDEEEGTKSSLSGGLGCCGSSVEETAGRDGEASMCCAEGREGETSMCCVARCEGETFVAVIMTCS